MVTDNKRQIPEQTHDFTSGMNTDLADALLNEHQYREAHNLRYVTNTDENTAKIHIIEGSTNKIDLSTDTFQYYKKTVVKQTVLKQYYFTTEASAQTAYTNKDMTLGVLRVTIIEDYQRITTGYSKVFIPETVVVDSVTYDAPSYDNPPFGYVPSKLVVAQHTTGTYTSTGDKLSLRILASTTIRQWGILILADNDQTRQQYGDWCIARFSNKIGKSVLTGADENNEITYDNTENITDFKIIYGPDQVPLCGDNCENHNVSIVTRYEDYDVIKLFIADGNTYIREINVSPSADEYNDSIGGEDDVITIYPQTSLLPIELVGEGTGSLTSGMVQYAYRLIKKQGVASLMSPLTGMIQLTIHTGSNTTGYYKGKSVGKSLSLKVSGIDTVLFNRILIYRIHYSEQGQNPVIGLITDSKLYADTFSYTDIGNDLQSTLSLEEFNSISGIHIIPKHLESKNDYLFAANIKKDSDLFINQIGDDQYDSRAYSYNADGNTYKNTTDINPFVEKINTPQWNMQTTDCYMFDSSQEYGGTGTNISYKLLISDMEADIVDDGAYTFTYTNLINQDTHSYSSIDYYAIKKQGNLSIPGTYVSRSIQNFNKSYSNTVYAYYNKSLRRGEVYRYGIIFYDKYGNNSPVKWIADIRIPDSYIDGFEPFTMFGNKLVVHPLTIQFTVKNFPSNAVQYEIVRAKRNQTDRSTLTQGVLSRNVKSIKIGDSSVPKSPLYPADILTVNNIAYKHWNYKSLDVYSGQSFLNGDDSVFNTFELISPEIDYTYNTTKNLLINGDLKLQPLQYIFGLPVEYAATNAILAGSSSISYRVGLGDAINQPATPGAAYDPQRFAIYYNQLDGYPHGNPVLLAIGGIDGIKIDDNSGQISAFMYQRASTLDLVKIGNGDKKTLSDTAYNLSKYYIGNTTVCEYVVPYMSTTAAANYWDDVEIGKYVESTDTNLNGKQRQQKLTYTNIFNVKDLRSTSEGSWESYDKRYDLISNINGENYCNWSFGAAYGDTTLDKAKIGRDIMGPNGRCMQIALDIQKVGTGDGFAYSILSDTCSGISNKDFSVIDTYYNGFPTYPSRYIGTYICNIKQNIVPYGGLDSSHRQNTNYYSWGDINPVSNNSIIVKSGDTFIDVFEHVKHHKFYSKDLVDGINLLADCSCTVYQMPIESDINLALVQGLQFGRGNSNSNVQIEVSDVYSQYSQTVPLYEYNTAYSITPSAKVFAAMDDAYSTNEDLDNTDYRCFYSKKKTNNESVDSWTVFQAANYLDVDTRYGSITDLRTFHNNLVYWQENAVGLFSVNERTAITDDNSMPLILGTGDVLGRYDYLATSNGMHADQMCETQSDTTLYWWDYNKREICGMNEDKQVMILSKVKGVSNLINSVYEQLLTFDYKTFKGSFLSKKPKLSFDKKYNEMLATIFSNPSNNTLVYSEQCEAFTSLYDLNIRTALSFPEGLYTTTDKLVDQWDTTTNNQVNSFGQTLLPYIKYVVNDESTVVKTFDNQSLEGNLNGSTTYEDIDTKLESLQFTYTTPLNQSATSTGSSITARERDYKMVIPRADNAVYGNRLRGKTMTCTISSTSNSYNFDIQYITTKYRTSWV